MERQTYQLFRCSEQNRRQKVFNRGLCVCVGWLDILKIGKTSTDLWCFMSQFGGLGALFGGISPTKPPRGDGTDPDH